MFAFFTKPAPQDLVRTQLAEAERELVAAEINKRRADSDVAFLNQTVQYLRAQVKDTSKQHA